jgi:crossover junction endodeoxyribonuclease RuvC
MTGSTVVGLDLSLTGAGVGTIGPDFHGNVVYGVYTYGRSGKKTEDLMMRRQRLADQVSSIRAVITTLDAHPDLALIETPAQSSTTGHAHDRSGLWWQVVEMLYQMNIPTMEVGIGKIKIYAKGNGVGAKDEIMAAAIRRYLEVPISNNNEADAFVLAALGARLLGDPIEEFMPKTHTRALEGLVLP